MNNIKWVAWNVELVEVKVAAEVPVGARLATFEGEDGIIMAMVLK